MVISSVWMRVTAATMTKVTKDTNVMQMVTVKKTRSRMRTTTTAGNRFRNLTQTRMWMMTMMIISASLVTVTTLHPVATVVTAIAVNTTRSRMTKMNTEGIDMAKIWKPLK
jgi:hypothetical protein